MELNLCVLDHLLDIHCAPADASICILILSSTNWFQKDRMYQSQLDGKLDASNTKGGTEHGFSWSYVLHIHTWKEQK